MADLPPLTYGQLKGRLVAQTADSNDSGVAPDAVPLKGTVTFRLSVSEFKVTSASPPATVFPQPITVIVDYDGYLSLDGSRLFSLQATDDPNINPTNLQWSASFDLYTQDGAYVERQPFNFAVPAGSTQDITVIAPLANPAANTIIIKGDKGEPGTNGKDGSNVLPTDTGVANTLNDKNSATYGAAFGVALSAAKALANPANQVVVPAEAVVARGVARNVSTKLVDRSLEIIDSVHEWWSWPPPRRIARVTRGAGYSSTGEVLAWDRFDRKPKSPDIFVVGDAGVTGPGGRVDDHDAPARWTSDDGGFSVIFWQNHGDDGIMSVRPSLDGSARGFLDQAENRVTIAPGGQVSYEEVFLHSISGNDYTFWVFTRSSAGWPIKVITVNRVTGVVTGGALYRTVTIGGDQPYLMAVQQGRIIRFAAYVNPQYNVHAIWMFQINMDTGIMTNVMGGASFDITSGSYLDISTHTPLVPETSTTQTSRRLYYPSPTANRVIYSEWTRGSEEQATYREARLANGAVTYRSLGPAAGPRNGYVAGANYNPGAAYSPDGSLIATLHNNIGGPGGQVYIHSAARSWLTQITDYRLSRPLFITNDELAMLSIDHYNDYNDFLMHQVSIVGFPEISGSQSLNHPLYKGVDTIYIYDPTFDIGWGDGFPANVPNLVDFSDSPLKQNAIGSGAILERTSKGAPHFAADRTASGNQSITIEHQASRDRLVTALQAGDKIFYGEIYRPTRAPSSSYAGSPSHRHQGIISTATGDMGTLRVNSSKTVVGYPTTTEQRSGSTTPADGVQIACASVVYSGSATPGTSAAVVVQHNGGANSPAESRIMYVSVAYNLTKLGITHAQAQSDLESFAATLFATGGRYASDTWTTPAA